MEEFMRITYILRENAEFLVDRYSERKEKKIRLDNSITNGK